MKRVDYWLNNQCVKAKRKEGPAMEYGIDTEDTVAKRFMRYKQARNEYTRARKTAQISSQKDVIEKSKDRSALLVI